MIEVKTADFVIQRSPEILVTHGIGSCVVVCFYSQVDGIGAMGHFMLPKAPIGYSDGNRYVDYSLDTILSLITKMGVDKKNLAISIVGGAQMFQVLEGSVMRIGERNVDEAKSWLQRNGLGYSLLDVGGNQGRNVEFDLSTGFVKVIKNS